MKARATCPLDCPDACSLLLTLEEGRLSRVEGDPRHPVTQGFACAKTYRYPERVRERLLYPMRRVGKKGEGRFERISWEEALEEIAERLRAILDTHGGEAILPYHYAGTMGLVENQHPLAFFRAIGASELEETICSTAGSAAWEMTYGPRLGPDPEEVPEARYILLWGINSLSTNSHLTPFLKEARRRGAKVVHIDPYENPTSRFADQHIKLRPGTDAALAYALAHLLFRENLVDWEYLKEAATGLEAFQEEARKWPPERAEALTGVPKEATERLARELGEAKRVFLRVGYGMTRHPGGGNALRAAILLPALLGAWRYPGCGALLSTSGAFPLNKRFLGGRHLLEGSHPHEGYFRPNPRVRRINMNQLASALTRLDPPIRALFVFNSNPLVVAPDTGRVKEGLLREDLLTMVLEQVLTETALYADYLLPATFFYEHPDLYTSYGHYYLSWNEPLTEPEGEAKPNTWVFRELGRRLGLKEPTLYWTAEEVAESLLDVDHPYLAGINLKWLKAEGFVKLNLPKPFLPFRKGPVRFSPPPEVIPTQTLPGYPLILLTPPAHRFLNTTYGNIQALVEAEGGEPRLLIHPQDARERGITDGMLVYIRSPQGRVVRKAKVTEAPMPGTVVLEGTWWEKWAPDGKGINHLTAETLTDLGGGSTFHSTPVEVEPLRLA
ncbi:molybdopterin oxidoreductase family protein [Thermus sp. SYSU G05001]|uniref:Molybdopterin oxidoreductase family protein n=1 Tax=Thermus brevis TaxID=2862456 RepID=A0ABS7A108_9DEIN|nr:molybdopterin oxidoreductase family protein [Thermus brevis]MBW6395775.1 molybdopterin oxidoreductase family protein [Thermus brevis]